MQIKFLVDEDFVNYKKPSMFIGFPHCTFKCDKDCGEEVCQNSPLVRQPNIEINLEELAKRYTNNPITKAIVVGGLEPFDDWGALYSLICYFRVFTLDDIVIYTGYNENEISNYLCFLEMFPNIIIKFGRFIPHSSPRFDEILGIELQSDNQYAKVISFELENNKESR
jgi:hypothetical protein